MTSLACSVSIQKNRSLQKKIRATLVSLHKMKNEFDYMKLEKIAISTHLQLVSVLTSVEGRTDKFHALLRFRLCHFRRIVVYLPDERARIV